MRRPLNVCSAMRILVVALGLGLIACSPAPTPAPSEADSVVAFDEQGQFRLELELPKATYAAGEPIEGIARLLFAGSGEIEVGGSGGGLIGFSLIDVDGPRDVGGGQDASCATYAFEPQGGYTSGLTKSGGYSPDDPADDFAEAFLNDPIYRLPAGTWEIHAWSNFLRKGCELPETKLSAGVRIVVTD
jgi:hypothetical protein